MFWKTFREKRAYTFNGPFVLQTARLCRLVGGNDGDWETSFIRIRYGGFTVNHRLRQAG